MREPTDPTALIDPNAPIDAPGATDPTGATDPLDATVDPVGLPRPSFSSLGLTLEPTEDTPPAALLDPAAPEGERTRAERAAWRAALPLDAAAVDALVDAVLALQAPNHDAARATGLATLRAEVQSMLATHDLGALDAVDARLAGTLARTETLASAGLDLVPALRARLEATRLVLRTVRAALTAPERR